MGKLIDLIGQRFGRLLVVAKGQRNRNGHLTWICLCDCGERAEIVGQSLRNGDTRSCGCLRNEKSKERLSVHGRVGTPEYKAWTGMIDRCERVGSEKFKHYGERGIKVCSRWRNSFEAFLSDMGEKPGSEYSLDRIDVNGNYAPSNCRWASQKEQMRNRRGTKLVEYRGAIKSLAELAENAGLDYYLVRNRIRRGWPIERALVTEVSRG